MNVKHIEKQGYPFFCGEMTLVGELEIVGENPLINNLRNILGPYHLKMGESYSVCPFSFFKESCVWAANPEDSWDDNYCFVEMSI